MELDLTARLEQDLSIFLYLFIYHRYHGILRLFIVIFYICILET